MPTDKPKLQEIQPAKKLFGERLRLAREDLQVSQELLADQAGMHRTYIGQVERGERNISVDNMEKLARAINTPLWEMLKP